MAPPKLWWDSWTITAFVGGIHGERAAYYKSKSIMLEMKLSNVRLTQWDLYGSTSDTVLCVKFLAPDPSSLFVVGMGAGPYVTQLVKAFMNRIKRVTRIDHG